MNWTSVVSLSFMVVAITSWIWGTNLLFRGGNWIDPYILTAVCTVGMQVCDLKRKG